MDGIRIDTEGFRWWVPAGRLERATVRGVPAVVLPPDGPRSERAPDGRTVGRAAVTAPTLDLAWLEGFTLDHGPLVAPDRNGYLYLDECAQAVENLVRVGRRYGEPLDRMLSANDWAPVERGGKLVQVGPVTEYAMRRDHTAPVFNQYAAAHVRLAIEGPELVIRPADLLGLAWLTAAKRILRGENVGPCRNKACKNLVERNASNLNSLYRQYCVENESACTMHVRRNPKDDRWPELRAGKTKAQRNEIFERILRQEMPDLFKGASDE